MTTPSPGPWNVGSDHLTVVVDANGRVLACHTFREDMLLEEMEANIQIMGASWDLFNACNEYHRAVDLLFATVIRLDIDFKPSKSGYPWEALKRGKNALDKAKEIDLPIPRPPPVTSATRSCKPNSITKPPHTNSLIKRAAE